jgi:hypothetical protein
MTDRRRRSGLEFFMTDGASGTARSAAQPSAHSPPPQNTQSGARPVTQPHDVIRALLRAGKNDDAIVRACAIVTVHPDDLLAKELLFDAFFQKRDWAPALVLAEELVRRQPNVARLDKALIATLSNMQRYDAAITQAFQYIVRHGEDLTILDALKVAHFYTGKTQQAIEYGQRAIELRDSEACREPPPVTVSVPATAPVGENVLSFSLWGPQAFYSYGAMINLVLAGKFYPAWRCRFYVDAAVPRACVAFLRDNGADVRNMEDEYPGVGLFQRFLVMNDPMVGRFLVRDCDARLSAAEAGLVQDWIGSGQPFHVMRDHVLHNELMIGCLWGGRTDCGIDIVALMKRYFKFGPIARYGHDQRMLGLMLWPLIRSRCLVHDKYYRLDGVRTVPLTDPKSRFGAGFQNLPAVLAEAESLGIPRTL